MFNLNSWSSKNLKVRSADDRSLHALQIQINKLLEDFFKDQSKEESKTTPSNDLIPSIDMVETDGELVLNIELPGMTAEDFTISVNQDLLSIAGEKKQPRESTEKSWYKMECQYGSFSRTIPLPYEIDVERTDANYQNGVLSLRMPKESVPQKQTKLIQIKTSAESA